MAKRRSFVLIVLILAIISLAIPESRRVMTMQLRYALKAQAYPPNDLLALGWPEDIPLTPPTTDAATATTYSTYLALAELDGDHRVQYSYRAIKVQPDRPVAYVSAIMACSIKSRYQRAEQTSFSSYPQYEHVTKIDPKAAAKVLQLAQEGRRIDPDNALFDLVTADMLFGLHKDADAIRMIHSAAGKPRYSDYRRVSVQAVVDYARSAGLPNVESRLVGSGSLWRMFLLQHRRVFEVGVGKARELGKSGRSDDAERLLLDLCRTGDLMCKGADFFTVFADGYRNMAIVGAFVPAPTTKGSADENEAAARNAGSRVPAEFSDPTDGRCSPQPMNAPHCAWLATTPE